METNQKNSGKRTKNSKNLSVFDKNPLKNDEIPSKNSGNPSKNSGKQAKNSKKRTKNDEKQAIFNEKQAFFDGKQAKNNRKQQKTTENKREKHHKNSHNALTNKYLHTILQKQATQTHPYIYKKKKRKKEKYFFYRKRRKRRKRKGGKYRERPERPVRHPSPHEQQLEGRRIYNRGPLPDHVPHIPTATPNETTACNARSRSTDKKTPHLCPIPVGFARQMRGNVPEKPRAIGHKPHGNRIQSPGQSGNLEFRVNTNQPLHE